MFDYSCGKVYKIIGPDGAVYVGSTICELRKRYLGHISQYNRWKLGKEHYRTIFKIFDSNDIEKCRIELLEEYPCNSKKELELREGYFIRELDCVNKNIAGRSDSEWREENCDTLKDKWKTYYMKNKDKYNTKSRNYYQQNTEYKKEKNMQYIELNRDLINEKRRIKYHQSKNIVKN